MVRLKKHQVLEALLRGKILPMFYSSDIDIAKAILIACFNGGIGGVEFVDRGENSAGVFKELIQYRNAEFPEMLVGIGTLYNKFQAQVFIDLGADFIISPIFDKGLALTCNRRKVLWIPGCTTMREMVLAESYGADLIKIFPAASLGKSYVRDILAPSPTSCIMVSGGIKSDIGEITQWLEAGASCIGLGSDLISPDIMRNKEFELITDKIKEIAEFINMTTNK